MFAVYLNYPSFEEEIEVVKLTTGEKKDTLKPVLDASQIKLFIEVIRKMPIADNVEYAVDLVSKPDLIQKEQLTLLTNILVGAVQEHLKTSFSIQNSCRYQWKIFPRYRRC